MPSKKEAKGFIQKIEQKVKAKQQLEKEKEEARLREAEIERAFMPKLFVQATLPHSDPKKTHFSRKNGDHKLILAALNPSVGLPYGKIPRLILAWIASEIQRTGERRIEAGSSLGEFLSKIGLSSRGGKRGDIKAAKEQLKRLAATAIYFGTETENEEQSIDFSRTMSLFDEQSFSFKKSDSTLSSGHIIVSERFFQQTIQASVPFDLRVLIKERSPLKIDTYLWLTYRLYAVTQSGKAARVGWNELELQFGSEYSSKKDFRKKFKKTLNQIKNEKYFKDLTFAFTSEQLILYKGKPHVGIRRSKRKPQLSAPAGN